MISLPRILTVSMTVYRISVKMAPASSDLSRHVTEVRGGLVGVAKRCTVSSIVKVYDFHKQQAWQDIFGE